MYFRQFYLGCLAQASYLLGSEGVAAVVDPQRDAGVYLAEAEREGLRIEHVILTHLHADFVSGHTELGALTGARIHIGARAGAGFPHVPIRDGDELRFGRCALRFLETPGHTPESICILVTDLDRSPQPFAVLTGDTLFVGDVGRPDLGVGRSPQELAADLYASIHGKLLTLPDEVEVFPAHGPGSLCGRQMSAERSSTIGRERTANAALQARSCEEFVTLLTAELPAKPAYFARDVALNREGPVPLAGLGAVRSLSARDVLACQREGATVLDTREIGPFGDGHVPGSVNVGLDGQFASWTATVVGLDADIILVADDATHVEESRTRLARVGIERVRGALEGGIAAWERAGFALQPLAQIEPAGLRARLTAGGAPALYDVRRPAEWEAGHIEGARFVPLDRLTAMLHDLDPAEPAVVYCKSGYRSSIAASLLQRAGFADVTNLIDGFDGWRALEQGATA